MFGDSTMTRELAEDLLDLFGLQELLDINDLDEVEVVRILLELGHVSEPRTIIQRYEVEEDDEF